MQGLRYIAAGAMMVAIIVLVVGCGGSSDSGTGAGAGSSGTTSASDASSPATSKAVFIKEANALCTKEAERIQRAGYLAFREHGKTGEEAEFRKALKAIIIPSMEGEAEGIESLNPPAADKAQIDALVKELRNVAHIVETNPGAYEFYPYKKAERLADAYGLNACGRPAPEQ